MAQGKKVGVVGAGNMGSGIVQKLAQEGFTVVMHDMKPEFVANGKQRIETLLGEAVARKIFRPEQVEAILGRIQGTTDLADLADCDTVIEAVFEDLDVKKNLFAELDRICDPDTILASNTSSFYVADLAEAVQRPERVVGLHFFYHPAKNRLVEVIPCEQTNSAVIARSQLLSKRMSKVPILCKDRPGFVVNRFFVPWLNESVRMLEAGEADIATIEAAAKKAFRIGMGPFELMNVTGVPIAWHAQATLGRELGAFYEPTPLLIKAGQANQPWDLSGEPDESKVDLVSGRLLGVVFQVAGELLDEEVCTLEEVDRGAKIGLRWALGPFELMNAIGVEESLNMAEAICTLHNQPFAKSLAAKRAEGGPWTLRVVDLAVDDGIATITLNRPEAMNAINETLVEQFGKVFDTAVARDDVCGVVIEGAGKAFVAGADVKFFVDRIKEDAVPRIVDFARSGQAVYRKIETATKPVIAKVDGLALGGGAELALACHAVVATDKATFGFPETSIGIFPGLGGTQRLARVVGKELAKYLVMTGQMLDGKTAHNLGLASYYADSDEVDGFVRDLLKAGTLVDKYADKHPPMGWEQVIDAFSDEKISAILDPDGSPADEMAAKAKKTVGFKAPIAVAMANRIFDEGANMGLEDALELELSNLHEIFSTEDALEGMTAMGRRRPEYKGR